LGPGDVHRPYGGRRLRNESAAAAGQRGAWLFQHSRRESPLGGHLRIARCAAIYFIDRPFFGRRSCSLQFINIDGGAMFKVFVGRDEKRELLADQLVRFERLRDAETSSA
jgi:putative heme utilization carrier protein HutX